jgi:hypothetical protein
MNLSWDDVAYESSYDVYRDGVYQDSVRADATTWTDDNLACQEAVYSYEVAPIPADSDCSDPRPCPTGDGSCPCVCWFQTEGGDVHAQGNISSLIPSSASDPFLSLDGDSGFPGVVSYGGDSVDVYGGEISSENWLSQDVFANLYDFAYFYQKLGSPDDNLGDTVSISELNDDGASQGVYFQQGDLEITGGSLPGGNKVNILVDGQVTVTGNFTAGTDDFLGIFASGNIRVDASVTQIEGLLFTDQDFLSLGVGGANDSQLVVDGSVIANDFTLERNLPDNSNPAELFRYRPDFIVNSPTAIWRTPHTWEEMAP